MTGKWLNDVHIHAAHQLLKKDCDLRGMQNTVRGQNLSFEPVEGDMVQILHSAGNHWLTVSTVGTEASNVVKVYDSLGTPLPLHTKKQIASLLKTKESWIRMEFANVQVSTVGQFYYNSSHVIHFSLLQRQHNYSNCGLFAVANATAICMEQQPESLSYSVGEMRRHFAGCLEDKLIRQLKRGISGKQQREWR